MPEFKIIENSVIKSVLWKNHDDFLKINSQLYPFGPLAVEKGIAPISAVFIFKENNNKQTMRGDRYTGSILAMLRKLTSLGRKYIQNKTICDVKIYDNRALIPTETQLILHWNEQKELIHSYLPFYSGEFDIKNKEKFIKQ